MESPEEDANNKKWRVVRNIKLASSQNGFSNSQLARSAEDEFCCEQLEVALVSNHSAI